MQKFETAGPICVVLEIPAGTVRLIATDRTDTTVEIQPADPDRKRDVKAAAQTTAEHRDGTVRITTADPHRALGSSGSVHITVELPAGSHLDGKAGAAELYGTGRLGNLVFDGGYRTVEVEDAATAHLRMHTGSVRIGRLAGPAHLENGMGDITVAEATSGALVLHTGSGDLTVGTAPTTSATLDATTPCGRIHNALRNTEGAAAALYIKARTGRGEITAISR